MIKTIIFDLGSVCFSNNWIKMDEEMKKKFGISILIRSNHGKEINEEFDKANIGKSTMIKVFKKICDEKDWKNVDEAVNFYKTLYKKHKTLNIELINLIKSLKNKYNLVYITDTNALHFECNKEAGLIDLFDKGFASHLTGMKKADKQIFIRVVNKLKITPKETIFIDDYSKNIEAAKSLGINAILFGGNNQTIEEINKLLAK